MSKYRPGDVVRVKYKHHHNDPGWMPEMGNRNKIYVRTIKTILGHSDDTIWFTVKETAGSYYSDWIIGYNDIEDITDKFCE